MCLSWSWHDQVCCGGGAPRLRSAGLQSALADCVANGNEGPPRFPRHSDFLSSELLIWPHKRPPHWDYLVICSPNFYEVDFPRILILFHFVLYVVAIWGGLPSSGFFVRLKEKRLQRFQQHGPSEFMFTAEDFSVGYREVKRSHPQTPHRSMLAYMNPGPLWTCHQCSRVPITIIFAATAFSILLIVYHWSSTRSLLPFW